MPLNTAVDRYIKDIKKSLVFSDRETKAFLKRLRGEIAGFVEENNTESLAEIENQFGSASSVAAAFYENTDIKDVKKKSENRPAYKSRRSASPYNFQHMPDCRNHILKTIRRLLRRKLWRGCGRWKCE